MSAALLDVNVLVALLWGRHALHQPAMAWFAQNAQNGWASCSITQAGFVRVLSNPAINPAAPSPANAIEVLKQSVQSNPHHEFWSENPPLSVIDSALLRRLQGHKQVTDAYLLALAIGRRARFVTFDQRMQLLAPLESPEHGSLVILRA